MSEAYDSDSESSSSVSPSLVEKEAIVNERLDDDSDDEEREEEVELDWDTVMSKLRMSINDRSAKKRSVFINRYLTVSETCTYCEIFPLRTY